MWGQVANLPTPGTAKSRTVIGMLGKTIPSHRQARSGRAVAIVIHVLGIFALGIAGAGKEWAAAALADDHRTAALCALVLGRLGSEDGLALGVEIHRRL